MLATHYAFENERAARHLFRVCAGLDAFVLGDTHVVSQVRDAHGRAKASGSSGPLLTRLFEAAVSTSKRIRSETSISSGHASIPGAAMMVASRIAAPLSERRLLVIGAGAIAQTAALLGSWRGCTDIVVANRSVARAQDLAARVGGRATTLDALGDEVARADVVISATAAPGIVLSPAQAAGAPSQLRTQPLLIVDLALPRDVDPALRHPPQVQLIDLDDLARIVSASGSRRRAGVTHAEAIAREEAARFETWRRSRAADPAIVALRGDAEQTRHGVLARHRNALDGLAPPDRMLVETITSELVAKLVHQPTLELRRLALEHSH